MTLDILPTPLAGVLLLRSTPAGDERGSFSRLLCTGTMAAAGGSFVPRQTSLSRSIQRGTLRGLHFQTGPSAETKLVTCVAGAIFDVALDLRTGSPTFRKHYAIELTWANGLGLLIPPGCAHGVLTLTDDAAVLYQIDRDYDPARASGVRWNDPAFAIAWPITPSLVSARDQSWPDFAA